MSRERSRRAGEPATVRLVWLRLAVTAVAGFLAALVAAVWEEPNPGTQASTGRLTTSVRPFAPESPFNTPIGDDVRLDPRSDRIVELLGRAKHATAAVYRYVPAVYDADASTETYPMTCTSTWGTCDFERMQVPIPKGARASPGSDASLVVIDWDSRRVFEFWQYRNDRRTVSWGSVLSLDGEGTGNAERDPGRYGATGSGVSRLAGIIRTHEITGGRIDHALVGVTGHACRDSFRYPASKTDGWSTDEATCIPQGARVQLDPAVDCRTLEGIEPWEVPVCKALQTYGWYNIDNGPRGSANFTVQFENPHGGHDPYPSVGLTEYEALDAIPVERLRVLRSWSSSR